MNEESSAFQVVLTSDSSLTIFKNNVLSEFSVLLPDSLIFSSNQEWGVCVTQVILPPVEKPTNLAAAAKITGGEIRSPIFVYLNIIESQINGDSLNRLACVLPPGYQTQFYQFSDPHYMTLNTKEIRVISVSMRDKFGSRYPFPNSICNTIITLRFKKLSS